MCRPQATISYYQLMHMQTAPLPVHFQMLCESSKLYDPGQQYASHVRQLQRGEEPDVRYDFEPHVSSSSWYSCWAQPAPVHLCLGVGGRLPPGAVGLRPGPAPRPFLLTLPQVSDHACPEEQLQRWGHSGDGGHQQPP